VRAIWTHTARDSQENHQAIHSPIENAFITKGTKNEGEEEPMATRSGRTGSAFGPDDHPLPETLAEAERLAASIERAVRRETAGGVKDLRVEVTGDSVRLEGHCETYYCKQLAQQAAMGVSGEDRLTNQIEVS
jgi:osmotically-inducible protein OsmY